MPPDQVAPKIIRLPVDGAIGDLGQSDLELLSEGSHERPLAHRLAIDIKQRIRRIDENGPAVCEDNRDLARAPKW